jgi:hypothetical protein
VPAVLAAANANWNAGGSIFTFYFPVGLFLVVVALLYLQVGRPHKVPGHRNPAPAAAGPARAQSPANPSASDPAGRDDEVDSPPGPPAEATE